MSLPHDLERFYKSLDAYFAHKGEGYEIKYAWYKVYSNFTYPFEHFYEFLKTMYHYIPILWSDRDWDQNFMLRIWEKKFRRMADNIGNHGHHLDKYRISKKLTICAALCKRLQENKYWDIPYEKYEEKWGDRTNIFTPSEDRTTKWDVKYENAKTEEDEAQRSYELRQIGKNEEAAIKRDYDYLFHILGKHVRTFWD